MTLAQVLPIPTWTGNLRWTVSARPSSPRSEQDMGHGRLLETVDGGWEWWSRGLVVSRRW